MNNKKAQAAMEFLMTYGWAILVVLVVIGALAYFGVLSPTALLPEKCFLPIGLDCEQHLISQGVGDMQFKLRNGLGDKITITKFWVEEDGVVVCGATDLPATMKDDLSINNCADIWVSSCQVGNGKSSEFLLGCGNNIDATDIGEKKKFDLKVVYYKGSDPSFTHTLTGELLSTIEP